MRPRHRLLAALPVCCIALSACGGQPAVDPAQRAESREAQPEAALTVVSAEPTLKYPKASWVVELTLGNPSSAPVCLPLSRLHAADALEPRNRPGRGELALAAARVARRLASTLA
jgi:hypothetical protein